jgi:hypothetical protein
VVDRESAVIVPPSEGTVYALGMPEPSDVKRTRDPSGENDGPLSAVVARNCSMVYCRTIRPAGAGWFRPA